MELRFPLLGGGTVSGLNDAGIETFEGDFASNVVRECAQNSLDAATAHPVTIEITRHSIPAKELPFLPQLRDVLNSCGAYWGDSAGARKFFKAALRAARGPVDLRIRDSQYYRPRRIRFIRAGRWFGLVKSRGVSNQKDAQSGGSFGIGKDAPLAGSAFRTALYSTKKADGSVAFQGVCRLVTHLNKAGKEIQGTGFIGGYDSSGPCFRAIRKKSQIPERFRRDEQGLDVWVLGCRMSDEQWETPFIRSALVNFWPAIHDRLIKFRIGDTPVSAENLGALMSGERGQREVELEYPYYRSLVDASAKRFEQRLPTAGNCRLHLLVGKRDLPKKVRLVRATGMVIDLYTPRIGLLPFSGLFVCTDPEGNRLLRSLEPPRHDKWDPKREGEPDAPKALTELKAWIRETLRDQIPHLSEQEFNETNLPPELQDEEEPDNPMPENTGAEEEPDIGRMPKEAGPTRRVNRPIVARKKKPGRKGVEPGQNGDVIDPGGIAPRPVANTGGLELEAVASSTSPVRSFGQGRIRSMATSTNTR